MSDYSCPVCAQTRGDVGELQIHISGHTKRELEESILGIMVGMMEASE